MMGYDTLLNFMGLPSQLVEQGLALLTVFTLSVLYLFRLASRSITWSTSRYYDLNQALVSVTVASLTLWFILELGISYTTFQVVIIGGMLAGLSAYGTAKLIDVIIRIIREGG